MHTRKMEQADIPQIKAIFEVQGFPYELPALGNNIMAKRVMCDETGTPRMGVVARVTVELYGFVDSSWETPGVRFWALQQLHEETRRELQEKGIEDGFAFIPPQIEKAFARRLMRCFNWTKPLWNCYARIVGK